MFLHISFKIVFHTNNMSPPAQETICTPIRGRTPHFGNLRFSVREMPLSNSRRLNNDSITGVVKNTTTKMKAKLISDLFWIYMLDVSKVVNKQCNWVNYKISGQWMRSLNLVKCSRFKTLNLSVADIVCDFVLPCRSRKPADTVLCQNTETSNVFK